MLLTVKDVVDDENLRNHPHVIIRTPGPLNYHSSCYPDGIEHFNGHGSMIDEWCLHRIMLWHEEKNGVMVIDIN